MNIEKFVGIVTAASPYALPPGAMVDQNNLQVMKPGQLTPRLGMSLVYQGTAGQMLAMHRATDGKAYEDRIIACRLTSGSEGTSQTYVTVEHLYRSGGAWQRQQLFQAAGNKATRPSFCQDRHGFVYTFFGNGITPQTFRYGIDGSTADFGMPAPTVGPTVTPIGDGWFIERVDVLASGTSYYAPPTLSISGGSPARNAKLRAVIQAGAIVAVDVIDGGSNYTSVPTITVSNEQIGTGFFAKGVLVVDPATYGFKETTAATPSGTYSFDASTMTHEYGRTASGNVLIAYRTTAGGSVLTAEATYNSTSGTYTALVPLTRATGAAGEGAFARISFSNSSSAYKVGSVAPTWEDSLSPDSQTSSVITGGTLAYSTKRVGWYGSNDYFENTKFADYGVANRFSYWGTANIDNFWGLGFTPNTWRFTKGQVRVKGVTPDDWLGNNQQINEWGNYYFPDYTSVSYKMLVGPCTASSMSSDANWQTFSSPVQVATVNGVQYPFIDITLQPAKSSSGAAFPTTAATQFPVVRIYLAFCPEAWTVDNTVPASQNSYNYRFTPQSGQDRRENFSDTVPTGGNPNGLVRGIRATPNADAYKRWWNYGHASGFPMPRPVVDFRQSANSPVVGISGGTAVMIYPGAQLSLGTAFAIRFEQFNAYDYRIVDANASLNWIASGPSESQKYRWYETMQRRSGAYSDFYFEANQADDAGTAAALVRPGAIAGTAGNPSVTIFGSNWSSGATAAVFFPTRNPNASATNSANWSASGSTRGYTFAVEQLIAASPQKTIGSIEIISSGQNYYREPTILFRGGGGYGLKVQSTVSDGRVTNVAIIDGGDGFSGDCALYTDVQPAKLMPILRGTMRGTYRCAYRFADYSATSVAAVSITTTRDSTTASLSSPGAAATWTPASSGVKPGMQLTWNGPAIFTANCTIVNGFATVGVPSLTDMAVGTVISMPGIPANAYITALYQSVEKTSTSGAAGVATIGFANLTGLVVGMSVAGTGVPSGAYITFLNTSLNVVTISANLTASASGAYSFGAAVGVPLAATSTGTGIATLGAPLIEHLVAIKSISGTQIELAAPARRTGTGPVQARDMSRPVVYSDFSPIVDVDASANGSERASRLQWSVAGVVPPERAQFVEFFRTSADQSLVFYRTDMYGRVDNGAINIYLSDSLSDEELFDSTRANYAALPVVLPNGGLNAYRFGTARNDMAVCVSWQDRLWYGVATGKEHQNTVFFSEYDEFESCPSVNELPIQSNLRTTDYLTALIPFGGVLLAMQTAHSYTINFNTDPAVDAVITLTAHRGCLSQSCWDIFDDQVYAADERGIYRMTRSGEVESLSEGVRDYFNDGRVWLGDPSGLYLKVDAKTGILRFFAPQGQGVGFPNVTLCYHIANKAWWTESWPNALTCACDYRQPSTKVADTAYGAFDGNIYSFGGLTDYPYRDIASVTITNGGSGYTTPPSITVSGGSGKGVRLRGVVQDGKLVDVVILRGGWNYGTVTVDANGENPTFNATVALTVDGGGGAGATCVATARAPSIGVDPTTELPILPKATVPWTMRTGPMPLVNDDSRGGDGQIDRSVTVTYRPTETSTVLALREFFNNSDYPRNNTMQRDRGTGFVHRSPGAKTVLDMVSSQTPSGTATGMAKARYAGRSLTDMASADRHVALELSSEAVSANPGDQSPSETLIYSIEVKGVVDGGQ